MNLKQKIALLMLLLFIVGACTILKRSQNKDIQYLFEFYQKNVPDDNPIEELLEEKIEDVTGLDLDLTPESEECE